MPLPDDARCRIILCDPPLRDDALADALTKLFAQFIREARCEQASCTREHDGAALVLAWTPDVALSGCSHDKIHGVLAAHGRDPVTKPFCVHVDGEWRCVDRAGLRGLASAETAMIDHRVERLGDWRGRGVTSVGASWAAGIARAGAPAVRSGEGARAPL